MKKLICQPEDNKILPPNIFGAFLVFSWFGGEKNFCLIKYNRHKWDIFLFLVFTSAQPAKISDKSFLIPVSSENFLWIPPF